MPRVKKPVLLTDPIEDVVGAFVAAKVAADPRGAPETRPDERPCVLDGQAVNSHLTVFQYPEGRLLTCITPSGEIAIPPDDLAHTLPVLAEVKRVHADQYRARQLNSGVDKPDLYCTTARECIQRFHRHFHDARE